MAKDEVLSQRVDPEWPEYSEHDHPVTELATDWAGSLSPFGQVEFPLDEVPYDHPHTEINK